MSTSCRSSCRGESSRAMTTWPRTTAPTSSRTSGISFVRRSTTGQNVNVVALAVTEGEDKPLKYPTMFAKADLVLLTEMDLLPHLPNTNIAALDDALARVMPEPRIIRFSAQERTGVVGWIEWLTSCRAALAGEMV